MRVLCIEEKILDKYEKIFITFHLVQFLDKNLSRLI